MFVPIMRSMFDLVMPIVLTTICKLRLMVTVEQRLQETGIPTNGIIWLLFITEVNLLFIVTECVWQESRFPLRKVEW